MPRAGELGSDASRRENFRVDGLLMGKAGRPTQTRSATRTRAIARGKRAGHPQTAKPPALPHAWRLLRGRPSGADRKLSSIPTTRGIWKRLQSLIGSQSRLMACHLPRSIRSSSFMMTTRATNLARSCARSAFTLIPRLLRTSAGATSPVKLADNANRTRLRGCRPTDNRQNVGNGWSPKQGRRLLRHESQITGCRKVGHRIVLRNH
jgi:hypothetical protein